jgi:flavin reductase (DIM6/NTAB) family NADH-FMN oxidoreductase RutF
VSALPPFADRFREAMRRTASGVAVIATDGPAGRAGLTVSTLCSLSLEPPSVIACVHRNSAVLPLIAANGVFTANVLAEDQARVAEVFAGMVPELREDRFAEGGWVRAESGAPALRGSLNSFDCRLATSFDYGSHRVIIGEVIDLVSRDAAPLIYSDRGFHTLVAA